MSRTHLEASCIVDQDTPMDKRIKISGCSESKEDDKREEDLDLGNS